MITSDLIKIADNQGSVCGEKSRLSCEDSSDASTGVCSTESEGSVNSYMLSPGGRRYFKPTVDASRIPFRGQVFETLEKDCKFYTDYGGLSGFDIRKTTEKRTEDKKTVILKHYVCNREGFNDVDLGSLDCSGSKEVQGRRTMSRRCGCKAKFVLKITSVKTYYVFSFVELHNHPLVSESGRHFLKANTRGTRFSRRHVSLDPSNPDFWDWTWDELVAHDLLATIDFVFKLTGQKIHYVGHSMDPTKLDSTFSESITYIEETMVKFGPFDGVVGFSQGVALTKVEGIKFVMLISGAKLGGFRFPAAPKLAQNAFSSRIEIPSLHCFGESDLLRLPAIELMGSFVDPFVIDHSGGHEIPKLDEKGLKVMISFLDKIQETYPARIIRSPM